MALQIVHHDITKIEVDAIVNSTNEHFEVGGLGVDASIHYAAGPELAKALHEIGYCPEGSAVITKSFGIETCRYIIHTVGPIYQGGFSGERKLLMSCYRSVLDLARENHCTSVAIPLISAGAYGYPKAEAYLIATSVIREWLYKNRSDIEINLVLYDSDDAELGRSFDSGIKDYINAFYEWQHKEHIREYYEEREDRRSRRRPRITPRREAIHDDVAPDMAVSAKTAPAAPMASLPDESVWEAPKAYDKAAAPSASSAVLNYADQDLSFAEMCEWWCARKHIPKGKFYMDSNITRATFSGMKQNPGRMPKKTTVLACVIGLKLDLDQAKDLLLRAGLAFSKHYLTDVLVEKYIREGIYDIDLINLELYEHDQKQLGYSRGE